MSVTGPNTGFKIVNADGGPNTQDLGKRYVSKDYLLDVYPNLIPGRTTPGLWAWGRNLLSGTNVAGLLGDGTIVSKSSPIQIGTLTNWKQVAAGDGHSLAIKNDGTLWAWGYNDVLTAFITVGAGGLGDGTIISKSSPVQIGSLTNWKQVDAGQGFSVSVKTDGTLWAWGSNVYGQLGQGNITHRSSPVQVGALTNWKKVATGAYHTAAVKIDGTIWVWGENTDGQIGDGTVIRKSSPVQIGSLTNWKEVAAGNDYTAAIKTDGTLWTWGNGATGRLGHGNTTDISSPVQVGSLTNWKQIDCGTSTIGSLCHTAAVTTNGKLYVWGENGSGQLGQGNLTDRSSPVQVGTLTNWKQVATGESYTVAVKTDGTLWAWGENGSGQLGQGNLTDRSSPVQVGSLTNWKQVAIGDAHTLAILDGYI